MLIGLCVVVGLACLLWEIGLRMDKQNWNNGVCTECGKGFWRAFDVDSSMATGYKCTECGATHWQNGYFRIPDRKLVKN